VIELEFALVDEEGVSCSEEPSQDEIAILIVMVLALEVVFCSKSGQVARSSFVLALFPVLVGTGLRFEPEAVFALVLVAIEWQIELA